jgi:hypothetical protein
MDLQVEIRAVYERLHGEVQASRVITEGLTEDLRAQTEGLRAQTEATTTELRSLIQGVIDRNTSASSEDNTPAMTQPQYTPPMDADYGPVDVDHGPVEPHPRKIPTHRGTPAMMTQRLTLLPYGRG